MLRLYLLATAAALAVLGAAPAHAQAIFPTNTPPSPAGAPVSAPPIATEAAQPVPAAEPLPVSVRLEGLSPVYQQLNRCSAAALTIQLSYFDWEGDYTRSINGLNPHGEDVAVRIEEMTQFARTQGFGAIDRVAGTADLLKRLIAAGLPVLVEQSYYEGEGGFEAWLAHNRVVMGYDDAEGVFYTYDSLLGNGPDNRGRPIPYDEFDERWRAFNRDYLVIYRPADEARVQSILGADWDTAANWASALAAAEADAAAGKDDGFTAFNRGSALLALGQPEAAAAAFDQARAAGLPWRMFWYQYGLFEAYLQVGRYDDVLAQANSVMATTPGVEEMYYYLGRANQALGNLDRAQGYYEAALRRNQFFGPPMVALNSLRAQPTAVPGPAAAPTAGGRVSG
jgi:tetratricopeptide (TPR) repeat protein